MSSVSQIVQRVSYQCGVKTMDLMDVMDLLLFFFFFWLDLKLASFFLEA
jgi:hypothetical protein